MQFFFRGASLFPILLTFEFDICIEYVKPLIHDKVWLATKNFVFSPSFYVHILLYFSSTKYAVRGLMDALYLEMNQVYPNNPIKMTVVHPFVINTGLAEKPRTRFSALVPILEPAQAASIIIKGVKQNHYEVFVPTNLFYLFAISNLFPLKVKLALFDFLGCGVDPHD